MDKQLLTWPARQLVKNITIAYFEHAVNEEPSHSVVLSKEEDITTFFDNLSEVSPNGGGLMVDFSSTIECTAVTISYENGTTDSLSIYGSNLKARDTSFYTDDEAVAKSKEFVAYVNTLLHK